MLMKLIALHTYPPLRCFHFIRTWGGGADDNVSTCCRSW
jgi:hypothetical protein